MSSRSRRFPLALGGAAAALLSAVAFADPTPQRPDISVRKIAESGVDRSPVRLIRDPLSGDVFAVYQASGVVARVETDRDPVVVTNVYTRDDTGAADPQGAAFGPDGTLYIVTNARVSRTVVSTIRRGVALSPDSDEREWSTLAETVSYPRSRYFGHLFNGIVVSPGGEFVFVNSGSRTDHGEVQDAFGDAPGLREIPLTSAIFRLPADGENIVLENDAEALEPYHYADGLRNSFDLAFDAAGRLFATENSSDRDDPEELNWIRPGRHYGFPWRLGGNDNPATSPDYDQDADPFLQDGSFAKSVGLYAPDASFPPPPPGIEFTEAIANDGPDADVLRDVDTGVVRDGTDRDAGVGTFTAHRSPLGLVFDRDRALGGDLTGDGLCLSWTGGSDSLLTVMGDPGEDLLHLEIREEGGALRLHATAIVTGFDNPVDAVLVGNRLLVLETSGAGAIWEVELPASTRARFRRGYVNADEALDISDGVKVLFYLFSDGEVTCLDAADVNDDGSVNIADAVFLFAHLFELGPAPASPHAACGVDPSGDAGEDLGCESFDRCEG